MSKKNKNTELVERIEIPNTKFTAVKINNEWKLTWGKYIMSKKSFENLDEIVKYTQENIYEIIEIMIGIITEYYVNESINNINKN